MFTLTVYGTPILTSTIDPTTGYSHFHPVGHEYYVLSDGVSPPVSYGFAPIKEGVAAGVIGTTAGAIYNNDQDFYGNPSGYSTSIAITEQQFNTLSQFGMDTKIGVSDFDTTYQAFTYSCVDFVWAALAKIGIYEPDHLPGLAVLPVFNNGLVSRALNDFAQNQNTTRTAGDETVGNVYDANGLVTQAVEVDGNGAVVLRANYVYNSDGTSVTATFVDGSGNPVASSQQTFAIEGTGANYTSQQVNYSGGSVVGQAVTTVSSESVSNRLINVPAVAAAG